MKVKTIIDENVEEKVVIYSKSFCPLIDEIKNLVANYEINLVGYKDDEIIPLNINEVYRFYVLDNKVFASCKDDVYQIKYRLYQIEEIVPTSFIKINKSCLVNKHYIKRFYSSWGGSLYVQLKNNELDYISRRQTKIVMERMNIK